MGRSERRETERKKRECENGCIIERDWYSPTVVQCKIQSKRNSHTKHFRLFSFFRFIFSFISLVIHSRFYWSVHLKSNSCLNFKLRDVTFRAQRPPRNKWRPPKNGYYFRISWAGGNGTKTHLITSQLEHDIFYLWCVFGFDVARLAWMGCMGCVSLRCGCTGSDWNVISNSCHYELIWVIYLFALVVRWLLTRILPQTPYSVVGTFSSMPPIQFR